MLADVRNELISKDTAREVYAVVVTEDSQTNDINIDEKATAELRAN